MTAPTPDEYTPTTQEVRRRYRVARQDELGAFLKRDHSPEFDRWLAQHDAEVGEKVAQAIEAEHIAVTSFHSLTQTAHNRALEHTARIAREVTS